MHSFCGDTGFYYVVNHHVFCVMEQNENTSSQIRFWYDWRPIKEECTIALKHTNVSKRFFSEKCTNTHWLSKRSKLGRFENAILVTKLLIHSMIIDQRPQEIFILSLTFINIFNYHDQRSSLSFCRTLLHQIGSHARVHLKQFT